MEIEVIFTNELDIQVFDKDFYQKLLENIRIVIDAENQIGNRTCACLDTSESLS